MKARHAQAIRFGILAARHDVERHRMTADQVEYLEGCELAGWQVGDSVSFKAYEREVERRKRKWWVRQ